MPASPKTGIVYGEIMLFIVRREQLSEGLFGEGKLYITNFFY